MIEKYSFSPLVRSRVAAVMGLLALLAAVMSEGRAHAQGYGQDYDSGYDSSGEEYDSPDNGYGDGAYEDYDNGTPYDASRYDGDEYEDGREVPDVTYFYDELEDEGRWVYHPRYGQVWIPHGVESGWRPYTRGHWANTEEYGWYWVSDEPFGWATYHYGRWHFDDRYGWVWVPGTRWAPAWVAWRSSDDYIGWAPLPPDSYWEPGHGLRYTSAIYESSRFSFYWSFIEPAYITSPGIFRYCAPRDRYRYIIHRTRPRTSYAFVNRRIVNRGVSVTVIEKVTRKRITKVRVAASDDRSFRGIDRREGEKIRVYRPRLTRLNADRDRRAGRPAIERKSWRDVDRRKSRKRDLAPLGGGGAAAGPVPSDQKRNANRAPWNAAPDGAARSATTGQPFERRERAKQKERNREKGLTQRSLNGPGGNEAGRAREAERREKQGKKANRDREKGDGKSCVPPYCRE